MRQRAVWQRGLAASLAIVVAVGLLGGNRAAEAEGGYGAAPFAITQAAREDQVQPRISGNWVVWKDYRHRSQRAVDDSPNGEIYARDLSGGDELRVSGPAFAGDPDISGTVIVWTDAGDRSTEIRGLDLQAGEIFSVTDSKGRQEWPAISGLVVVWQDNRNGNWDIFARDLTQGDDLAVVDQPDEQTRPAISGRTVVWEDWRDHGPGSDIFGIDLDSRATFRVTSNHDAEQPAISGRWVVWIGMADQGLFAQNLDDGATRRLSTAGGPKSRPAISGDLVVWTDERGGNRDVYGYDLVTGTEFPIARDPQDQQEAAIDGTTVVWSDARGRNWDIYGAQLTLPREVNVVQRAPNAAAATDSAVIQPVLPVGPLFRVTNTDGQGVNLRAAPSLSAAQIKLEPEGAVLEASGQPAENEGRTWRQVRDAYGATGWVAAEFLAPA